MIFSIVILDQEVIKVEKVKNVYKKLWPSRKSTKDSL